MFKSIRTSEENKEIISKLTRKLNLGSENVIARLALAYSLSKNKRLNLDNIKDSQGKEYSSKVLFGENEKLYLGMISNLYGINLFDRNSPKYVKIHIDQGLELILNEFLNQGIQSSQLFLVRLMQQSLINIKN